MKPLQSSFASALFVCLCVFVHGLIKCMVYCSASNEIFEGSFVPDIFSKITSSCVKLENVSVSAICLYEPVCVLK